jgi:hypothetical protein
MPVIENGDTIHLPYHKVARVSIDAPEGLSDTVFRPVPGTSNKPVFEVGPGGDAEEAVLHPLRLGTSDLEIKCDGDPGAGVIPLRIVAHVRVFESMAVSLQLTYTVEGGTARRIGQTGAEVDLPVNRTARLEVVGIGVNGEEVPLSAQTWESGNEAKFIVAPDPENASVGVLTPVEEGAFVPLAFSCDGDASGSTVTVEASVSVSVTPAVALDFDAEYEIEDPA